MPPITALLFAHNDSLRIGRALETLWFAAEIVVVNRGSCERTSAIARQYGARVIPAESNPSATIPANHDWVFCLSPRESIGDELEASLFEWSLLPTAQVSAGACYSVQVREELDQAWVSHYEPQTRLIPRDWPLDPNGLPGPCPQAQLLPGWLLRFSLP
jgi:glycosyltransferase involved in cell wall biosynthesis